MVGAHSVSESSDSHLKKASKKEREMRRRTFTTVELSKMYRQGLEMEKEGSAKAEKGKSKDKGKSEDGIMKTTLKRFMEPKAAPKQEKDSDEVKDMEFQIGKYKVGRR